MKHKNVITIILMLGIFFLIGAANQAQAYNEARVRYILADISLGGSIAYYRDFPNNPNAREALQRWERGVRVLNIDQFDRCDEVGGAGIVYAGTCDVIDGMDVDLTSDHPAYYRAPHVRIVMPDFNFFGIFHNHHRRIHSNEQPRRWGNDNNNHNNNWRPDEPPRVGAVIPNGSEPGHERP